GLIAAYCDNTTENNGENVFNAGCDASYDLIRATACYNNARAHNKCDDDNIISTYCNDADSDSGARPFNTLLCTSSTYAGARVRACLGNETVDATCPRLISNRIAFCRGERAPDPVTDVCSGVNVCIADPFADTKLCGFTAFDGFKTDRRTACSEPGPTVACMNAKVHLCVGRGEYAAPFVPICSENSDIALQQRIYCYLDNTADADCTDINEKTFAVAEVWQYSAVDTDGETSLNIVRDTGEATERANFTTSDAVRGLNSGDISTLTLADNSLGGAAADGAFHTATVMVGNTRRTYAGILDSTNLGAPLVAPNGGGTPTLIWTGKLRLDILVTDNSAAIVYRPDDFSSFQLTIDFANAMDDAIGTVTSTSTATRTNSADTITLAINGSFNKFGVIYGTTTLTRGDASYGGVLTGLIGIEG
ncbi:MAG: hypothetical protein K8953_00640, partial [Proteobacteria bacterium]|nr:hypothetical protein [Pseudomonadota bacterium]